MAAPKPYLRAPLTASEKAEIRLLAREGWTQTSISAATGHASKTVRRHAGDLLVRGAKRKPDLARWGRLLRAVAAAGYGERAAIAQRFGYASVNSLSVSLVKARRHIARANQEPRHGL